MLGIQIVFIKYLFDILNTFNTNNLNYFKYAQILFIIPNLLHFLIFQIEYCEQY